MSTLSERTHKILEKLGKEQENEPKIVPKIVVKKPKK